jgi:hypothetical protein
MSSVRTKTMCGLADKSAAEERPEKTEKKIRTQQSHEIHEIRVGDFTG